MEVKSGVGPVDETLAQLAKDERLVKDNWSIVWDLTTKQPHTVMTELERLANLYPGRFTYKIGG